MPPEEAVVAARLHTRVRRGLRHSANWLQLIRFALVGVSGYVVNLGVFAVAVHVLSIDYRIAAVLAFLVALANNFVWNRHWTFDARAGRAHHQAARFFAISLAAFAFQFGVLQALVDGAGLTSLLGQALSVAAAMPINFIGNKLWSFKA
ncbi:MAG: GtrA family protein [Solirubrobacteraceae bacterium]